MFFNDHAPAHFHAEYAEFKAAIDIRQLRVFEGELPPPGTWILCWIGPSCIGLSYRKTGICTGPRSPQSRLLYCCEEAVMYWDVVEVKALEDLGLFVRFADGLAGEVRFTSEHLTGVFTPLNDPAFFEQVYLDHGAVAWPGQIDLAPDAMYREIKENGVAVVS